MAGVEISIKDSATPMLRAALKRLSDFTVPLKQAGMYLQHEEVGQFNSEGTQDGTPWAPLSPRTIAGRRKGKGVGIKPLQDTRRLLQSIISKTGDSVYEITDNSLRIGTNVKYAAIQKYGGTVQHTLKDGTVRLRTKKNGAMRFAKASFKGKVRTVSYQGGKQFSTTIPARPFLLLTPKKIDYITNNIFRNYAMKKGLI